MARASQPVAEGGGARSSRGGKENEGDNRQLSCCWSNWATERLGIGAWPLRNIQETLQNYRLGPAVHQTDKEKSCRTLSDHGEYDSLHQCRRKNHDHGADAPSHRNRGNGALLDPSGTARKVPKRVRSCIQRESSSAPIRTWSIVASVGSAAAAHQSERKDGPGSGRWQQRLARAAARSARSYKSHHPACARESLPLWTQSNAIRAPRPLLDHQRATTNEKGSERMPPMPTNGIPPI